MSAAEAMVRKQVYLLREQDQKLKRLARERRCTEAEVMRAAIDSLPDPAGGILEQLAAAGILAAKRDEVDVPRGGALRALEAEMNAWLAGETEPIGLADAVEEDRASR